MPVRVEVPGKGIVEFPDGTPPEVMESALAEFAQPQEHPHARVARLVGENLPAIGGLLGGMAGSVGGPIVAAGTAGLGGAAGRLAQRAIGAQGLDVKDVATEGAKQGAIEAVGGAAGKMLGAGARRLYQGLARPSKALRAEHPDAVRTALEARAPISQGGIRKIDARMGESAQQADDVIRQASAAMPNASRISAKEIVPEFAGTVKELRKRVDIGQPSELGQVGNRGRRLIKAEPAGGFDLERAQQLKKTAQNAADAGYRQAERGTVKEVSSDTMLDKDVARGFRKAIEKRVPAVAGINKRTQSLGGAKHMLEDAVGRESNNLMVGRMGDLIAVGAGAGLGNMAGSPESGAGLGLLLRLLSTPSTGSRAAIAMNELARTRAVQQALRTIMASHGEQ